MVVAILIAVAGIATMIVGLAWLARVVRRELTALRAESSAQLADRTADVDRRLGLLSETMDARLGGLDARLQAGQTSSGATATKIAEKLGELGGTASQMLARANDLARLEQALRPPKARGGFGELLLEISSATSCRRLRSRHAAHVLVRRPVVMPSSGSTVISVDSSPPGQLRAHRRGRGGGRAAAPREGLRPRCSQPRRRDRRQVHPPRRRHLRLRVHVHPGQGRLLRARLRKELYGHGLCP